MIHSKTDILKKLQKEILPLQGLKASLLPPVNQVGLGPLNSAFAHAHFPLGAIHEFLYDRSEDKAATSSFIAALISTVIQSKELIIWISTQHHIFPPALKQFGLAPEKIIFIDLKKEQDVLWVMEEAIKCDGLGAVIGEVGTLSLTASRRLQLAVEKSCVTGFLIRKNPQHLSATACIGRWKIKPLQSISEDSLPGMGYPRWHVELLKIRNGKPGNWQMEWSPGGFRFSSKMAALLSQQHKKTG